ncbi:Gfo/Idh/MocA family protein [Sphingobacterium bovistauri]|uniref:Gfo/Idh/MocA family oxidoreductase n=1 Tax=Sphingobacterium bovistauri TaxID=2781959 RepID=A0ABS7Z435_9SPHI|nr:Gfo/Idh/MocA family oxidoreductase [Sphingobacterium bovistauri]MCA5004924.1 Gfo/Idh/MocA family oxidoreductase [Sphingobacterium bovistauri]
MNRKNFFKASAILAASTALYNPIIASTFVQRKIRVGLIGVNGMGWANLNDLLKVENVVCTALCDVDSNVLNRRKSELEKRNINVKIYDDHRKLLSDDIVDVVIIATPDHWHCIQFVDAVKAGKHVYIEKPIGNSIRECEVMVSAAAKSNSIVQVGQWQRSQQHFKDAMDFVHSGKLGKIRLAKAWSYVGWKDPIIKVADAPVPAGVNYDKWLGPAQKRNFNPNRFHFEFRWFWDYAGGLMTDWGVHLLDFALIGMKAKFPKSIVASGGVFADPNTAAETPDTLTAMYEFDDFNIQWEHALGIASGPYNRDHGVAFIGNNGTLVVNRGGWEVIPDGKKMEAVSFQKSVDNGLERHMQNFVQAILKKDKSLVATPIEAGSHVAIVSQMGNIAYRTGQKIYWDQTTKRFKDEASNKYLAAAYHNGYSIPQV